ncbi:YkgJ family cysteine cluster protein [Halalkalicoccus salilacus]|uniref:YkgJ family cysteine cluster protein n=1 Tax=Halalkalicoccus salilacus TaxID=3117459 RepID=UPI00300F0A94
MESLETELERARALDVEELADAIESIGFECTRCGACCKSEAEDPHTATVFPDEVRELQESGEYDYDSRSDTAASGSHSPDSWDWRDVARPMPYGLQEGPDGPEGETFEWALATDSCGDCTFYEERDGVGACTVHEDRPLICRTYPFSVVLSGGAEVGQPMGEAVDSVALETQRAAGEAGDHEEAVRAHECEGLGREIAREDAEELARTLKERAVRELEEAIGVRENYRSVERAPGEVVVHDSEGPKTGDGTSLPGADTSITRDAED